METVYGGEDVDTPVFLRAGTKIEPLVCRWPAWPHLISPAQHAMNLAFRQLPNLQSFIANPSVHLRAARDPAMLGGPFVSLEGTDIPQVRALLKRTQESCSHLLRFAEELREFDGKLQSAAHGGSLDELYTELPESLRGLLELTYDLNGHPRLRLLEALLYAGGLDNTRFQEVCLHCTPDHERAFFMSTPFLESSNRTFLPLAFADSRIDELAAMRYRSLPIAEATQRLGVEPVQLAQFRRFFTTQPPVRRTPGFASAGLRVRYFGHACVLLQTSQVSILIDPLTAWERDENQATLTFDDLPDRIDYVILSHAHQDHCVPEMLLQLRGRVGTAIVPHSDTGNLADPSMRLILQGLGYRCIRELGTFESIKLADGEILSLPFIGEHAGLDIGAKHCVRIQLAGRSLLFLVDSDAVDAELYRRIAPRVGPIDVLFIGMECNGAPLSWLYGPLLTRPITRRYDESRRLSGSTCDRAWHVVKEMGCSQAYVYGMGQESWLRYLLGLEYTEDSIQITESNRFVARCREAGIQATRLLGCREIEI